MALTSVINRKHSWLRYATQPWWLSALIGFVMLVGAAASAATPPPATASPDTKAVFRYLDTLGGVRERLSEVNRYIDAFDDTTPTEIRSYFEDFKLDMLANIGDAMAASAFAATVYQKYERSDFLNDVEYGNFSFNLLKAFAKSGDLNKAFQIVQQVRGATYESPNPYLDYILDRGLMEIYIETLDYERAIEIQLSMLNNADYQSIENYRNWYPSLLNEISFAYNKSGQGEKALKYLNIARAQIPLVASSEENLARSYVTNDGNLGRAHILNGNYQEALVVGRRVLAYGEANKRNYYLGLGHRLIGSSALRLGDYQLAEYHLAAGVAVAEKNSISILKESLFRDYAELLERQGKYGPALEWEKKYRTLALTGVRAASDARLALSIAEEEARLNYFEIQKLRTENLNQLAIQKRNNSIKLLLGICALILLLLVAFLIYVAYVQKRSRSELAASNQKAQQANEAKSVFLANMSHEIRTPMNGILGMAELLQGSELNDQQQMYADTIYNSGSALISIINDILDFSKVESGKFELDPFDCSLKTAIEEVATLLATRAAEKGISVYLRYNPELPERFVADIGAIRQVVTNLVGNAIKFTHTGYVFIDVDGNVQGDVSALSISVKDTGIGIPADKLSHIFENFTQAESSTTRNFGGSGLGLAISKRLAQAMGGDVSVTSVYGEGSVFRVDLMLPLSAQPQPSSTRFAANEGRPIAIIFDENPIGRSIYTEYLNHFGMSVHCAKDVTELKFLLQSVEQQNDVVDVVLSDVSGLNQDAKDFIEQRRHSGAMAGAAIVGMSCTHDTETAANLVGTAFDELIPKPVRPSQLENVVYRLVADEPIEEAKDQVVVSDVPEEQNRFDGIAIDILVAEDNQVNRLVIKSFLDRPGVTLTFAENGREALNAARTKVFDLVLMDISMPEMDGLDATKAIRSHEVAAGLPRVPIICLTAHVLAAERDRALAAGMDDILTKPVQKDKLESAILRWHQHEAPRAEGGGRFGYARQSSILTSG